MYTQFISQLNAIFVVVEYRVCECARALAHLVYMVVIFNLVCFILFRRLSGVCVCACMHTRVCTVGCLCI